MNVQPFQEYVNKDVPILLEISVAIAGLGKFKSN